MVIETILSLISAFGFVVCLLCIIALYFPIKGKVKVVYIINSKEGKQKVQKIMLYATMLGTMGLIIKTYL